MQDYIARKDKRTKQKLANEIKTEAIRKDRALTKEEQDEHLVFMMEDMYDRDAERGPSALYSHFGVLSYFPNRLDFYGHQMKKPTKGFKEQVNRFDNLIGWMYRTNKLFFPTAHHWQHGEFKWQAQLANMITNVATEKYAEREAEYGDYDDEVDTVVKRIPVPIRIEGENIHAYMKDGVLHIEQKILTDGEEK